MNGAGQQTRGAVRVLTRVVRPVVGVFFRPSIDGLEHLPDDGAFLLVSNHNAGLGIGELSSFAALWAERFQGERPLAAFAHPIGFKVWPVTALHRAIGSIPSTYEAAYATLEAGIPILVFPGGDHETFRPVWQANRVDFGGRKGFLRIAAKTGVPIVPMGIRGSHFTAPILLRSKPLAWLLVLPRLLGVKRWTVSVLSVVGCVAIAVLPLETWLKLLLSWLWVCSPAIFLPWVPWTIRMRVGEPLEPADLFDGQTEPTELDDALARVESAIQGLVSGRSSGVGD